MENTLIGNIIYPFYFARGESIVEKRIGCQQHTSNKFKIVIRWITEHTPPCICKPLYTAKTFEVITNERQLKRLIKKRVL
jgi:hypothetical protein